jgi:group II intron reverse transcriptase/maturase
MLGVSLTTLAHHIDIDWMKEAWRRTRKDGAPGVDGQSAQQYAEKLDENLRELLERAKSGDHYRAPPVRRVHIPKGDGRTTRPIGIPTLEDKVLQRAVAMVVEAVYEQEFLPCSYGFRPNRSAHDAIREIRNRMRVMRGGWVLEADIEKFFDSVDHAHLRAIVRQRIGDGVLLRLIGKWLKAGVMEEGAVHYPDAGTPQGGVISPLLANIFLHEVLDKWWTGEVQPRMRGETHLVRYADDFVMLFETEHDARRVLEVLALRLGKFGLRLHPDKTRLLEFRPEPPSDDEPRRRSFDLLGFTLFWAKSIRGRGWYVSAKTSRRSFSRSLKRIRTWLKLHRHDPVRQQRAKLIIKLRGHDRYFGVATNYHALERLRWWVMLAWWKALRRRSRGVPRLRTYVRFCSLFALPRPRTLPLGTL